MVNVSLMITCLGDLFYPEAGKATVELLEKCGCTVDFPAGQTCCGQPAYNSGYQRQAKLAAMQMIRAFEESQYVVTPSGSCAAMVKEYPSFFEREEDWKERAEVLAEKTYELTEFIVDVLQLEDVGAAYEAKAVYHPSCHMMRLAGIQEAPLKLLRNVKGLEIVSIPHDYECCGFGGTFSIKMPQISGEMVEKKAGEIEAAQAEVLIGADAGCLMNIGGRLRKKGKKIEMRHIAEILNQPEKR